MVDSAADISASFAYDQANSLKSYASGSTSATYADNGDGPRMSKTVGSTATSFAYDQAECLPLIIRAGSTQFVSGPNGMPAEQVRRSAVLYYLADHSGSTRAGEQFRGHPGKLQLRPLRQADGGQLTR